MLRARVPFVLMLVLPFTACSKPEPTVIPAPEPPVAAKTESENKAAPAELATAKAADALASPKPEAPAPDQANAKAPPPAGAGAAGKEIAIPKGKDGVLGPGAADKVLPVGAQPIVKLIDAGAEPRSDLSYALTKGGTQKLKMDMDMVMSMKMGPKAMPPTTIPTMSMQFDMTITDKNPSGDWKVDSKLVQASVGSKGVHQQEQMAAAMRPQIEALKGLGMGYWINAKGHVRDVKLDIPKSFPASAQQMLQGMNQSFESMVAPLPSEPVGVGARWQVVSRMGSAGADLLQSATYTLKARDGGKVTLDVALVQLAASDAVKAPGMPPGVSAQMKSFNSGGSGTSLLDTKNVAPDAASMALKTSMDIVVRGSSEGDESVIETQTKVGISKP